MWVWRDLGACSLTPLGISAFIEVDSKRSTYIRDYYKTSTKMSDKEIKENTCSSTLGDKGTMP